ncbi:MAG: 30S ribosomal protein S5 [Candidatus Paceibacterota bacterium]
MNKENNPNPKRRFDRRDKEVVKDEFDSKLLDLARVTKVTGGGKTLRFRAVIVVGNKEGKVGVGVAKGLDVSQAIDKATRFAKKNIIVVPILQGTIPHEVEAKYGPSKILLKPQQKGKGLVAGGTVRIICALAGVQDISSKILSKTTNKLNNARATIMALQQLKPKKRATAVKKEEVAATAE